MGTVTTHAKLTNATSPEIQLAAVLTATWQRQKSVDLCVKAKRCVLRTQHKSMEPTLSQLNQTIEDSFGRLLEVHRTQFVTPAIKIRQTGMRIGGLVELAVQEDNTGLTISAIVLAKKEIEYHVASSQMTLPSARSYCHYQGGFLVKPRNEADTNSIKALLPSGNVRAWLGIYQRSDMTWLRDNGDSMGWTNWKSGEGNDRRGVTAGAAMVWQSGWSGEWYDMPNYDGRVHYVVCELSGRRALVALEEENFVQSESRLVENERKM